MKYFTIPELCASSVAAARRIINEPDQRQTDNLTRLIQQVLDPVREKIGVPVTVTSGFRSPALNKAVGGVATSQHLEGEAADIIIKPVKGESQKGANKRLFNTIEDMVREGEIIVGQLLDENNFSWVHVSIPRTNSASPKINDIRHL